MTGSGKVPANASEAEAVERKVGGRITPSAQFLDRVAQVRVALVERVTAAARARSSPLVRALVAGSAARGTFLQDRLDVDLFLLFPPDLSRDRLREEGLALGRAVLSNPETRYAEHPYLRGTFEGFTVDAVPGFAITDPSHPLSPVDRTPFHQEYLAARETSALVEQVRLAKQFFRYARRLRVRGQNGGVLGLPGRALSDPVRVSSRSSRRCAGLEGSGSPLRAREGTTAASGGRGARARGPCRP